MASNTRIIFYVIGFIILANIPYLPGYFVFGSFLSWMTGGNLRSIKEYPSSGVILLGRVLAPELDLTQINIRWTIAGWGNDTAVPLTANQRRKGIDDRPLAYLTRPVNVYFDGEMVKSYTPGGTVDRTPVGSKLNQFSTTHLFDGPQTRGSLRPVYLHRRTANIEIQVVDPTNNKSLPIIELACGPGRLSTGWLLETKLSEQQMQAVDALAPSGSYIFSLVLREYPQKIACQLAVAFMTLLLSVAGLVFTLYAIVAIVFENQTISTSDILAFPLGIGATVSAFRVILPPNSDWEHWIDTALFYPALIYALISAALGFILSRDTSVQKLRNIVQRADVEAGGPDGGVHH